MGYQALPLSFRRLAFERGEREPLDFSPLVPATGTPEPEAAKPEAPATPVQPK